MNSKILKHSICLLLAVFLFDSCALTKRRYNKGFHLDWLTSHSNKKDNVIKAKNRQDKPSADELSLYDIPVAAFKPITLQEKTERKPRSEYITKPIGTQEFGIMTQDNKSVAKNAQLTSREVRKLDKAVAKSSVQNESSSSRGIGVFMLVLGILVALVASLTLGLIMIVLGIIIMGRNPKNPTQAQPAPTKEKEVTYVDVVYLKNGSVIKGQIMEQIPNESLKIQTAGGSIFVYKMEELTKITKEAK
ncbi:hypothetical protein N9J07_01195 [Bacteroidia bacterium]|nr:hypothetical protein [Bacteroidia bacterium]